MFPVPVTYFLKDSSPAVFITYAEVLFIFAESAARGWITADAETLYREAITASLNQFGIIDNRIIDSYLQQEAIRFDAAHWYESIGWQKWIAYYGQGPDAFTDCAGSVIPSLSLVPIPFWVPESYLVAFFIP